MALPGLQLVAPTPIAPVETLEIAPTIHKLPRGSEWRFEVAFSVQISVKLVQGTAEIFGTELGLNQVYFFTGTKASVYTWHGCQIEVHGECEVEYIAEQTPMESYVNTHFALEKLRRHAATHGTDGPRVMVVGPENSGKTSLVKILTSYATKLGRQPLVVNLDPKEAMMSIPGTLTATSFSSIIDVEEGWGSSPTSGPSLVPVKLPLVYNFGYPMPEDDPKLFKPIATRLALAVTSRLLDDQAAKVSGCIIDTSGQISQGKDGYNIIKHLVSEFSVNVLIALSSEKLQSDMTRRFDGQRISSDESISVLKLIRSGGCVDRDAKFLAQASQLSIRKYYFGTNKSTLSPHTLHIDIAQLVVYKLKEVKSALKSLMPGGDDDSDGEASDESIFEIVEPSSLLQNSLLAIMRADFKAQDSDIRDASVIGYVVEYMMENILLESIDDNEPDPVLHEFDIFLTEPLKEKLFLLQYPNRERHQSYTASQGCRPLELRLKPNAGLMEIDVPLDIYRNYDKEKGVRWGEAVRKSNLEMGGLSLGIAGGFGIGSITAGGQGGASRRQANPTPLTSGEIEANERLEKDLIHNFEAANSQGRVLNKQTLGGNVLQSEDGRPIYMAGTFRGQELHLSTIDHIVQLRPQFHHLDAFDLQEKSASRAQNAGASDQARSAEPRAVQMTVKSSEGEEIDMTQTAKVLRSAQEEDWIRLKYQDRDQMQSREIFKDKLFLADTASVPVLQSTMSSMQYLDAISCPRIDLTGLNKPIKREPTDLADSDNDNDDDDDDGDHKAKFQLPKRISFSFRDCASSGYTNDGVVAVKPGTINRSLRKPVSSNTPKDCHLSHPNTHLSLTTTPKHHQNPVTTSKPPPTVPMCSSDIFLGLIAILFPPLAVWVKRGLCSADSMINIALCCLGFIPGLLHAWYIIAKFPESNYSELAQDPEGGVITYYYVGHQQHPYRRQGQPGYGTAAATGPVQGQQQGVVPAQAVKPQAGPPAQSYRDVDGGAQGVPPSYAEAVKGGTSQEQPQTQE
ncbi:MAG: Cleavage polyadenylation factor subunit clp1 [Trizodia sp. TS-e1964]|nr:MAG: Cleavage polyadenylation factor subunit clp1 [Trizodia sp. TS-e1964]